MGSFVLIDKADIFGSALGSSMEMNPRRRIPVVVPRGTLWVPSLRALRSQSLISTGRGD